MILRNAALLLLLVAPTLSTAYLTEINNAHIELLSNGASANTSENVVLEQLLENKLWGEYTASQIRDLFEEWVQRFERKYESLAEKGQKMLIWLQNHGEWYNIILTPFHELFRAAFALTFLDSIEPIMSIPSTHRIA